MITRVPNFRLVIRTFATLLAFVLAATSAKAQDPYDVRTLFRKGAWAVELTHDTIDGGLWCSAETDNRQGQAFALTGYENGGFTVFIFDSQWNISPRPVRFLVDVDYSRWTMDGSGDGIAVSITPGNSQDAIRFTRELMEGSAVAVLNTDEHRLATFSLNGSFAAITRFIGCWESINNTETDPFSSGDPFSGASDPFR